MEEPIHHPKLPAETGTISARWKAPTFRFGRIATRQQRIFFTNFLDIMHSPLCYSLFKATKSFCLRLHELTGTQFHGIIHPEKCWNVTGRVGLTNSILYLRVGVSDGAGRFFTQNRADATLHSASGDTGADAAVAVQKAAFEAEPKWTDSGRLCTIRTIRVSPSLF